MSVRQKKTNVAAFKRVGTTPTAASPTYNHAQVVALYEGELKQILLACRQGDPSMLDN